MLWNRENMCDWWGQRVDWRVNEGGGLVSLEQPWLIFAHRQPIKILRLPHPASLKTQFYSKHKGGGRAPSRPFPRFPLLSFPVAKTQWCAKSLENSPQLYRILGLLQRKGTSEASTFALKPPACTFVVEPKLLAQLDRSFFLFSFFFWSSVCGCWSRFQDSSVDFMARSVERSSKENEARPQHATACPSALLMWRPTDKVSMPAVNVMFSFIIHSGKRFFTSGQ